MAKWIFAVVIAGSFMILPKTSFAEAGSYSVDGCAKLAQAVYSEVQAAAIYGTDKAGPWVIDAGQGDVSICSSVAKTVSQAFTSAMQSAGVEVFWDDDDVHPRNREYCLSGFLSQCYPGRERLGLASISSGADLVQRSWAIVSQSVMREMFNPHSSDEVRFRDDELKLRLGLSLRSVRQPLSNR